MTEPNQSTLDLYDLFIIGCDFLRQRRLTPEVTYAYKVLCALSEADCYPGLLRRNNKAHAGLRGLVQARSHIVRKKGVMPTVSLMAPLAADTGFHFVMLVRTEAFEYARIIGSPGYPIYLTSVGGQYARSALTRFPDLTAEKVAAGMSRYGALQPSRRVV